MNSNNFKALFAVAVISMSSAGALHASDAVIEDDFVVVNSAPSQSEKKPSFMDNLQIAGAAVQQNIVPIKEEGAKLVTSFTDAKALYEDMCAKHEGVLRWYHKAKYAVIAYAKPFVSTAAAVYTYVVKPIMEAFAEKAE